MDSGITMPRSFLPRSGRGLLPGRGLRRTLRPRAVIIPNPSLATDSTAMGSLCVKDHSAAKARERLERQRLIGAKYGIRRGSNALNQGFAESDICHRCHKKFNMVMRRHHCRRCKHSFCSSHSSKFLSTHVLLAERPDAFLPDARSRV